MVEKIVIDPETGVAPELLAQKLNEVIELLSRPPVRPERLPRRATSKLELVEVMERTLSRLLSGPHVAISQPEPNDLTRAVGEALQQTLTAVASYKASLPPADGG